MEIQGVEILLIEDNIYDAEMTMRALKQKSINPKICHFTDGIEALEYLFGTGQYAGRNINIKPKVIFLDLKMPKLNGIEVLARLKSNEVTKVIPVVVMTSSSEDPDIKKCYALGANSYIVKPVDFERFLEVVAELGMYWVLHNQTPT